MQLTEMLSIQSHCCLGETNEVPRHKYQHMHEIASELKSNTHTLNQASPCPRCHLLCQLPAQTETSPSCSEPEMDVPLKQNRGKSQPVSFHISLMMWLYMAHKIVHIHENFKKISHMLMSCHYSSL